MLSNLGEVSVFEIDLQVQVYKWWTYNYGAWHWETFVQVQWNNLSMIHMQDQLSPPVPLSQYAEVLWKAQRGLQASFGV